ncbi:MAG: J domain-containing protein [Spirochaetaceae bacterium]|nr:J domain-containing protein [Spirochaetaceae bacterium]
MNAAREPRAEGQGEAGLLAILGLGPGSGEEEIKAAYRRLAKRWHPDSSKDPATARQFARVARAYKILSARPPRGNLPLGGAAARYRRVMEAGEDLFALGQVLAADPDPGAREAAVRRLGLSGRTAAFVFLRRALYDPAPAVAEAAVRAVALLGSRQAEGEVAALYARSSPALRRGILETAAATREPLFGATLRAAARDEDFGLRALAAKLQAEQS